MAELRKITRLPQEFEDPCGLPKLSEKQRSSIMGWMRPYDICDNPKMIHLISSFSIKQASACIVARCRKKSVMRLIEYTCLSKNVFLVQGRH